MEYESRQVKWYWLSLFLLYCTLVVYLLFSGNPYLYSNRELRSVLSSDQDSVIQTIPTKPDFSGAVGSQTFETRYNRGRTAIDPAGLLRSAELQEYIRYDISAAHLPKDFFAENVSADTSGFYISGKSPWVLAFGLTGEPLWKFKFKSMPPDKSVSEVLLDEAQVYFVHPNGEVISLAKNSGVIRWISPLERELVAKPFIWESNLVLPVKSSVKNKLQLLLLNRNTGKLTSSPRLDLKPGFFVAHSPEVNKLIFTVDNKVIAIDPEEWTIDWSQTLTGPIKGPATIYEGQIFVTTLDAKILKLDGLKKGKVDWDIDLDKPALSPVTYLPLVNRLAFLDSDRALTAVDAKTGKVLWKYGVENRSPLEDVWAAKLKGQHIEEFKMDWVHKGWTIWSPCSEKRFCIYTPSKGQLIERIALAGAPLLLPLAVDRRLIFFTEKKPGSYAISHVLEEAEIKRLKAQQAMAAGR